MSESAQEIRPYRPVTPRIVAEIEALCGEEHVLSGDSKAAARYAHDQVSEARYAHAPELVVKPATAREVAGIMALATREVVPVTPRGAGSGLSGGAVPIHGGICLSLERMSRIVEIDAKNRIAVVEPGVVTNELDGATLPHGLFFAGYPMSEEFCFVGGNVAENAGGGRAVKYGVTGRYVVGAEVVLPTGEILDLGGKRAKDASGYDLLRLLVGSEGTLAIFTKVFLRLLPRPLHRSTTAVFFRDPRSALEAVPDIVSAGGQLPSAVEYIDRYSLVETCSALGESLPLGDALAMLLLEVDGASESAVALHAEAVREACRVRGALSVLRADGPGEAERLWRIRKRIPWALRRAAATQTVEDVVVPVSALPELLDEVGRLERTYDTRIPCFGHAGDGNIHARPQKGAAWTAEEWDVRLGKLLTELYAAAARLGGTISGEHGIGHKRKPYLPLVMEEAQIALMRRIKRAFDPANILNPGKIFD